MEEGSCLDTLGDCPKEMQKSGKNTTCLHFMQHIFSKAKVAKRHSDLLERSSVYITSVMIRQGWPSSPLSFRFYIDELDTLFEEASDNSECSCHDCA